MIREGQPFANAPEPSALLFDHYLVERTLGRGAMGVVYLARDLNIGRLVALKTLPRRRGDRTSAEFVARFRREAELSGSLSHPNIVTLYEVGHEGRQISFLAMEFIDGESLFSLMNRKQIMPAEEACRIVIDVLSGLACAHQRGVVHRDIKPANILLNLDGVAKITDFGIARSSSPDESDLTDIGQLLGTPHYMAPEHVSGKEITCLADLFSVGVVFFEMLSGRKPFDGSDLFDVLNKVVVEPAPELSSFNPKLPYSLVRFVHRLLEKQPHLRYPSATAARDELRQILASVGESTSPQPARLRVRKPLSPEETPTTPINVAMLLHTRWRPLARRNVHPVAALGLIGLMATALVGSALSIQSETSDRPTAVILPSQLAEMDGKRQWMHEGVILYEAGNYAESLRRFESYLARYPVSLAAREGRDRARAAMVQPLPPLKLPAVQRHYPDVRANASPLVQPKPSAWQRFLHFFHRSAAPVNRAP